MLEYLELSFDAQNRECTGMQSGWDIRIDVSEGTIKWQHGSCAFGIMPEPAFKDSSDYKKGVYTGDVKTFLEKLEATGFREWNHEFFDIMVGEGEFYNLKYKDHGQEMVCMGNIEDVKKVEEMEWLLLSLEQKESL